MSNPKIKEAAFKCKDGTIVGTGSYHNLDLLPENSVVDEEGFTDNNGNFLSREDAAKLVGQSDALRSEDLNKVQPTPTFPKLGLGDNRRETPILSDASAIKNKNLLMGNALALKYSGASNKEDIKAAASKASGIIGRTGPSGVPTAISYAKDQKNANKAVATQLHEDHHMLLNRVQNKYGGKASINLTHNLFNSIPEQHRKSVQEYVSSLYGTKKIPAAKYHEEHLAHLLSYLNSPKHRELYHRATPGHWDHERNVMSDKGREFQTNMKQAYRALQGAAKKASPQWTKKIFKKSEIDFLTKGANWAPTAQELDSALNMAQLFDIDTPEFAAAKFLSNQYCPSDEELENALTLYEGDVLSAALCAHRLPVNEENRRLLREIMAMQEFSKTEGDFDVAILPRNVKPYRFEDAPVADLVREAYKNGEIYPIKLNGKHSSGTAILKDHDTDILWLLKPGNGKLSPALGVREETASQSKREVAFNVIAKMIGLGRYFPNAALVVLDNHDVAALEFFADSFKPVEKIKREGQDVKNVFVKFVDNGLLHKWAFIDYLCGQSDRHFGNVMVDESGHIKFIDAGSAFSGVSFNPAQDPKSFAVCYLRAFLSRKYKELTPKERFEQFPSLHPEVDKQFKNWIDGINERNLVEILNKFNINPQPVIDRLKRIKSYPKSKSEFLNRFWSGYFDPNL